MKLDRPTLHLIGEALFGLYWEESLAGELVSLDGKPMNRRTVERWASGAMEIPSGPDLVLQLANIAARRGKNLQTIAKQLREATVQTPLP